MPNSSKDTFALLVYGGRTIHVRKRGFYVRGWGLLAPGAMYARLGPEGEEALRNACREAGLTDYANAPRDTAKKST